MLTRFYVAPQQGDGSLSNPYRSILNDLININQGDWFDEIDNPARHISICCVHALQTSHDAILADGRALPIGSIFDDTQKTVFLNSLISSIPNLTALKASLEGLGISTSWFSGSNTIRDGIRYLMRVFSTGQIADGEGNTNIKNLISRNLDVTVQQIPPAIRNAVRNWMQAKGLAIGWINNSTTVREILHFIVSNLDIGKLKMSGEEF
jgi:hypothetical protein